MSRYFGSDPFGFDPFSSNSGALASLLAALTKRSVFISYHHGGDQYYYDQFSYEFATAYNILKDNSVEDPFDSDDSEYVMRQIREEYLTGSSCTIVLCGQQTYKRKFVDWEIKATLDKQHGLVGLNLPTSSRNATGQVVIPDRLYDNIQSGYALWVDWTSLSVANLKLWIEQAIGKSAYLIANDRDIMSRNSS